MRQPLAGSRRSLAGSAPVLLPYQSAWIADRATVKVCEKSRRVGLTWAEAADAALDAAAEDGSDWWYIGYNREMALEFVETAAGWARYFDRAAREIEQFVLADGDKALLAFRIRFASGHKIAALSSRPSNLRGKQGTAIIDEAAFHDDLDSLLKAAIALTMWGGRVHVISTHNGADNPFNRLVTDIRAGRRPYSLHRITLDDALQQGLFHAICHTAGTPWSETAERDWRRRLIAEYGDYAEEELLCVPSSHSTVFLPAALIEARMKPQIPVLRCHFSGSAIERGNTALTQQTEQWIRTELEPLTARIDPQLLSCFGEDFGRSGDLTVIWPMQVSCKLQRCTPFVVELRNVPFRQQARILFYIVDRLPRFIGAAMDARGNGQYLAEETALRYGPRVEQVMLSTEWYRDNMPRYKAAFEDGRIELPKDLEILADHRLLRIENGVARLPEQRTRGRDGGARHGDSAIAGALAYYASYTNHQQYEYTPARQLASRNLPEDSPYDQHSHPARAIGHARMRFGSGAW